MMWSMGKCTNFKGNLKLYCSFCRSRSSELFVRPFTVFVPRPRRLKETMGSNSFSNSGYEIFPDFTLPWTPGVNPSKKTIYCRKNLSVVISTPLIKSLSYLILSAVVRFLDKPDGIFWFRSICLKWCFPGPSKSRNLGNSLLEFSQ